MSAQQGVPVNPQLFGYNLEVFGTMTNNSMSDTGGVAIADALHLGTLRYPGGTMSNVWDSKEGRYVKGCCDSNASGKTARSTEDGASPASRSSNVPLKLHAVLLRRIECKLRVVTLDAGVYSDGSYGVAEGLIYSFPVTCSGGDWSIVQGVEINAFSQEKMDATESNR